MDYCDKDDFELLDLVEAYAKNHPKFNIQFVLSLRRWLEQMGILTKGQRTSLENIIKKYRIIRNVK